MSDDRDSTAQLTFERESSAVDAREINYEEGPLAKGNDKCTDSCCCIAFVVFWVLNFGVFYIAYIYGDAQRLFYATDYEGNTCGQGDFANRPLGFYPRLPEDALAALQSAQTCAEDAQTGQLGSCDMSLYTVCVSECPVAGEVVCNYQSEDSSEAAKQVAVALRAGCWVNPIATTEIMRRCVPALDEYDSQTIYECDGQRIPTADVPSKDYCMGLLTEVVITEFNTTAGADTLMRNLVSTSMLVTEYFGDVVTAFPVILAFGLGASIVVSFLFVYIMQYIAGCVVWLIIILLFCLWVVITSALMLRGGEFFGIDLETALPAGLGNSSTYDLPSVGAAGVGLAAGVTSHGETTQRLWIIAAHAAFFFTIFYVLIICAIADRIELTIEVLKVTSNTLRETSGLFFVPFVEWLALAGLLIYFLAGTALIWTTRFSTADLKAAVSASSLDCGEGVSQLSCARMVMEASINSTGHLNSMAAESVDTGTDDSIRIPLLGYHLFGVFWCANFYSAMKTMIIAAAVAEVFWTKAKVKEEKRWATKDAFCYIFRWHMGSAAFGALILAIVQFMRAVLAYVQSKTEEMQKQNKALKIAMCACQCCLWCFEKVIKYLSHNAYILVAIDGESFCYCAWKAFTMLLTNVVRIPTVQALARIISWLGVLCIGTISTVGAYYWFETQPQYQPDGESALNESILPTAFVFILASIVGVAFTGVWNIGVDTVLFSFLLDESRKKNGDYKEMGEGWSMTSAHWPHLAEYMEGPRQTKSSAEEAKDQKAAAESRPPQLCCCEKNVKTAPQSSYTGAPSSA